MTVDDSGVTFDGSGVIVNDPGVTFDGSGVIVNDPGVTFDGSDVTVDDSGVAFNGSGVTVEVKLPGIPWRVNNKREPRGSLLLFRSHSRQVHPCNFPVKVQCIKICHPGYEIDDCLQLLVQIFTAKMVLLGNDGEQFF